MSDSELKFTEVAGEPISDEEMSVTVLRTRPLDVQGTVGTVGNLVTCTLAGPIPMMMQTVQPTQYTWQTTFGTLPSGKYNLSCSAAGEGTVNLEVTVQ